MLPSNNRPLNEYAYSRERNLYNGRIFYTRSLNLEAIRRFVFLLTDMFLGFGVCYSIVSRGYSLCLLEIKITLFLRPKF